MLTCQSIQLGTSVITIQPPSGSSSNVVGKFIYLNTTKIAQRHWHIIYNILKASPIPMGNILFPHDAAVHEYSTGLSRVEVARNHAINFTVVTDISINEAIDAARNMFNRCWFDETKCAKGVTALENYKKHWNDRHGCCSCHPLHNFASHGADAFRMMVVGLGKLEGKGLSAKEWRSLRQQYVV